jgi:hypothetical protein
MLHVCHPLTLFSVVEVILEPKHLRNKNLGHGDVHETIFSYLPENEYLPCLQDWASDQSPSDKSPPNIFC